ncbi:hypothetical protein KA013_02910 [Patescibacteria group bacterium]|nr:hypothetical protein [Patescibacteria group bacterium]
MGQYGLKHVALIKLIEKLKHHSYGLTREQIKLLEKYGMPEHVKNVKLFLESQLKKMPPTTRQQKQDLIYKVIEVASVYNMSLPEEQWITEPEINALAESMSDVLYNINTVEDDRKQMLRSPNPLRRDKAIEHFSTHYISNMIKNDTVMTYSARLDHFLQMMLELKGELDSISTRDQMTQVQTEIRKDHSLPKVLSIFKKIYNRANQNYILHSNEHVFAPEAEDLFFKLCLAESYEASRGTDQDYDSTRRTDEIRETFNNKV